MRKTQNLRLRKIMSVRYYSKYNSYRQVWAIERMYEIIYSNIKKWCVDDLRDQKS